VFDHRDGVFFFPFLFLFIYLFGYVHPDIFDYLVDAEVCNCYPLSKNIGWQCLRSDV
jgi:hypothetical protein